MDNLKRFLEIFKVHKGDEFTHTTLDPPVAYCIPVDKKNELLDLLYDAIFVNGVSVSLTEKPPEKTYVKADIDLRYPIDDGMTKSKYTTDNIKEIVQLYNTAIKHFLDVPDEQLKAFIFERDELGRKKGFITDGLHIMYPYLIVDTNVQLMIREEVLKNCIPILSKLGSANKYDEIIDKSIVKSNNWFMYGCTKPAKKPYKLTHIYDNEYNDMNVRKFKPRQLIELLSIRDLDENKSIPLRDNEEFKIMYEEKLNGKKIVRKKDKDKGDYTIDEKNEIMLRMASSLYGTMTEDLQNARQLTSMLAPERATHYRQWLEVGWCLYNISPALLDSWKMFSKSSPDVFKDGEKCDCEHRWVHMERKTDGLGIGSLHRWAKIDNMEEYKKFVSTNIKQLMLRSTSRLSDDVANVIHEMYRHQYVCASVKHDKWYEFKNHRWKLDEGGVSIYNRFSKEVLDEYLKLIANLMNIAAIGDTTGDRDKNIDDGSKLTEVTKKLRDSTFKGKLMKELSHKFYDSNFLSRLNQNPYLLGCENGVFDLRELEFRDGRPEDMLTFSTRINYNEFDEDHDDIIMIKNFFSKLFVNESVRNYVFLLLASFLEGFNRFEQFYILTGIGANGKSKLLELMRNAIGDYGSSVPVSVFTAKRASSGSANPEIAKLVSVRFVETTEPEDKAPFNGSLIKEWSGNDKISYRDLYQGQTEFTPMFKIMLSCNNLPKLQADDDAIWRRIVVIPFNSRFIVKPNMNDPLEFKRDDYLKEKLFIWKEAFLYMLIEYYKIYIREYNGTLTSPNECMDATNEYRKVYDVYNEFISEHLIKTNNMNDKLLISDIYEKFKGWWKQTNVDKPPNRSDMKILLEKKLGKYPKIGGWTQWTFKEDIEERDGNESINIKNKMKKGERSGEDMNDSTSDSFDADADADAYIEDDEYITLLEET